MVLNLGFTLPQEASTNYQGDVNRYALYNMESLVNKFTRKCICFFNLFNTRGIETKDNYLRGVVQRRLRTTGLVRTHLHAA